MERSMEEMLRFFKRRFPLDEWRAAMKDERRALQISAGTVAQVVIEMVARGQRSLLEVDQSGRLPEVRAWFGSRRDMVVSDTTLVRSLSGFVLEPVREVLWEIAGGVKERSMMRAKLPSGRRARLGNLDGSGWGGFPGSVLTLVGRSLDIVAGYRMSPGRGHELETSRAVLREALQHLGRGFVDLLVVDALYMTEQDMRWALEEGGCHLVVKSTEENLSVIQDARGLFFGGAHKCTEGIERVEGLDTERGVHYRITAAAGFEWHGLRLKVAHVSERFLKPKKGHPPETEFWVITTDETLSAEDMREVAHLRWCIENRTFRRLNHLVESKRPLTKGAHVREALLGLWFIGLDLFGLFLVSIRMGCLNPTLKPVKKTWRWFCELFKRATAVAYFSKRSP